jgi:hypothetical protein
MLHMCFPIFAINSDIIKDYQCKVALEGPKNFVHMTLKGGRGIAKTKRYH